jgi:hypothetical protein
MNKYIELSMEARWFNWTEANYNCERCWRNNAIDYHHINWRGKNLLDVSSIILLCRSCHEWVHSNNRKEIKEDLLQKVKKHLI